MLDYRISQYDSAWFQLKAALFKSLSSPKFHKWMKSISPILDGEAQNQKEKQTKKQKNIYTKKKKPKQKWTKTEEKKQHKIQKKKDVLLWKKPPHFSDIEILLIKKETFMDPCMKNAFIDF